MASWGFGMIMFVFAIPAVHTMVRHLAMLYLLGFADNLQDTFGRRNLLLFTFPVGFISGRSISCMRS